MDSDSDRQPKDYPKANKVAKYTRGALQAVGGSIPFMGGVISVISGAWSDKEQEKVNDFFQQWLNMLQDELNEKEQTILEIMQRLDMHNDSIAERVQSKDYQYLLKKTFREWKAGNSEDKRVYLRNILTNAAVKQASADDVIGLFTDWIGQYSELHFHIIATLQHCDDTDAWGEAGAEGYTRQQIWHQMGLGDIEPMSSDDDLSSLVLDELVNRRIIRKRNPYVERRSYEEADLKRRKAMHENLKKLGALTESQQQAYEVLNQRGFKSGMPLSDKVEASDCYSLTALGSRFVEYAMSELPVQIEYQVE